MRLVLVGVCKERGKINSFVIEDIDTCQTMVVPYENVYNALAKGNGSEIDGIEIVNGKIEGSNGSFDRYSQIDSSGNVKDEAAVITDQIIINGNIAGYKIIYKSNVPLNIKVEDILSKIGKINIANGTIVNNNGSIYIRPIKGQYKKIETTVNVEKKAVKDILVDEGTKKEGIRKAHMELNRKLVRPLSRNDSRLDNIDENTNMTVLQKLTWASYALKSIRPYYYSTYVSIKRYESLSLDTAGVTVNKLYFNPEFVRRSPLPQLVFTIMHEMLHIVMKHNARKHTREHEKWNCACDLYINKVIADELGLKVGEVKSVTGSGDRSIEIELPEWVLYNENVDIDTDTPEKIYNEMKEDNDGSDGSDGDGSGNGSSNRSEEESGNGSNTGNQGKGKGKKGESGKGENESGNVEDQSSDSNNGNGTSNQGKTYKFRGQGYRVGGNNSDIVEDAESASMTDRQKKQLADTMAKKINQHVRNHGGKPGNEPGKLEREIEDAVAEKIDWKKTFRGILSKMYVEVNSFTSPDRRFISRNKVFPGPKQIEEEGITEVFIGIDSSGSMSDTDIAKVLSQAKTLMEKYNAVAHMAFWDTKMTEIVELDDPKDIKRVEVFGGGGTDPTCIFEHFSDGKVKRKYRGKVDVALIFTDGYINMPDDKYSRVFKNTIWVITDDGRKDFEQPFGRLAYYEKDE